MIDDDIVLGFESGFMMKTLRTPQACKSSFVE